MDRRGFLKFSISAALMSFVPSAVHAFSGYELDKYRLIRSFTDKEPIFTSGDYFEKIKNFNKSFHDDLVADAHEFELIKSCQKKTGALMRYVGFGHFNLLNFDDAVRYGRNISSLQAFTKAELDYIEELFSRDASVYGFYGERIFNGLTDKVNSKDMIKIPRSGHYVYKADSHAIYEKITKEMDSLILTSGVRSVMKQLHLFLSKAVDTKGNLSMASRSIAPVGYSYHGIGDFDVGIKGWGYDNFTDKFATTREYSMLIERGYMRIRYDRKNPYGVRFEPWHVKVV